MSWQDERIISVIYSGFLHKNHHIWHQEFIKRKTSFGHNYSMCCSPNPSTVNQEESDLWTLGGPGLLNTFGKF